MARPSVVYLAVLSFCLILQTRPSGAVPAEAGQFSGLPVVNSASSSPPLPSQPINVPFTSVPDSLPGHDGQDEAETDAHEAEESQFQDALPRNLTDAFLDTLFNANQEAGPGNIRSPLIASDETDDHDPGGPPELPPFELAPASEHCQTVLDPVDEHLLFLNYQYCGDGQGDRRQREHANGSQHPLFGVAAGAVAIFTLSASKTPGKRKRPSNADDEDVEPKCTASDPAPTKRRNRPNPYSALSQQPGTGGITHAKLVAEVQGIYAGLIMIEKKCIEVDASLGDAEPGKKLNSQQMTALVELHRTLLFEHLDFFQATQHPNAREGMRHLAEKYAMPARMWKHGIHSFLELLRRRMPGSHNHMLYFIDEAYTMLALLYETVPAFKLTWIEALGDLSRYRMAIEDNDTERETWASVSRHWYSLASHVNPTNGRLHHHLAILSHPNILQQLFFYTKSLCVSESFGQARGSIMTLFQPVMDGLIPESTRRLRPLDVAFVKAHAALFMGEQRDVFEHYRRDFLDELDYHIKLSGSRCMQSGYLIAICNIFALMGYGKHGNPLSLAMASGEDAIMGGGLFGDDPGQIQANAISNAQFQAALKLFSRTCETVFRHSGDPGIFPFTFVTLSFIRHLAQHHPSALVLIHNAIPWDLLASHLNDCITHHGTLDTMRSLSGEDYGNFYDLFDRSKFPPPKMMDDWPLPEDFALRGLPFADTDSLPDGIFEDGPVHDYDYYRQMTDPIVNHRRCRVERILWLGAQIAFSETGFGSGLLFCSLAQRFGSLDGPIITGQTAADGNGMEGVHLQLGVPGPSNFSSHHFTDATLPMMDSILDVDSLDLGRRISIHLDPGSPNLAALPGLDTTSKPSSDSFLTELSAQANHPAGDSIPNAQLPHVQEGAANFIEESGGDTVDDLSQVIVGEPIGELAEYLDADPIVDIAGALAELFVEKPVEKPNGRIFDDPVKGLAEEPVEEPYQEPGEGTAVAIIPGNTGANNIPAPSTTVTWQCDQCPRNNFTNKTAFSKHKATHVKPFFCRHQNCDKSYASPSHLEKHVEAKHTDPSKRKKFSCDSCPKEFPQKHNLLRHQQNAHGALKSRGT